MELFFLYSPLHRMTGGLFSSAWWMYEKVLVGGAVSLFLQVFIPYLEAG